MPSLFSRSRTTSSPHKSQKASRSSARGAGTAPPKKDRNVEKTRTRTLSAAKGRAPGPMPTEEEPIIPDGSFFPLNLDPPGDDHANPSESERGQYLSLSLFFSRYLLSPSPSHLPDALWRPGVISSIKVFWRSPMAVRGRQPRVSLVVAVIRPRAVEPWIFLLTMSVAGHRHREQEYGYLSYYHHIVLGLEEVDSLVHTVTEELSTRGLTTPFLFSSLALDVNSSGVRRLIQAFLRTCVPFPAPDAERTWHEEARFAAPAELAMCLRWGLARILRVSGGNAVLQY